MPITQAKKTFIAEFVSQVDTAVAALNYVADAVMHTGELAAGQMPACLVYDGGVTPINYITSTQDLQCRLYVQIIADGDTTVDGIRDIEEAVIDAINADVTLGGTCISCLPAPDPQPPMMWNELNKFIYKLYIVRYRRDY